MGTKVTSSSGSVLEEPEIQKLQMQAKIFRENSLNELNALKSTTQLLDIQSIWYQQAFARLFGDSFRTFKFQLSQHMNNLETLLNAETLHEMDSKSALSVIKVQFERFINSDLLKPLDIYSRSFSSDREKEQVIMGKSLRYVEQDSPLPIQRYLKKAQSKKPCLYEIPYDTSDPANRFAPDREETMTLDNESRSKLDKDTVKPYEYTRNRMSLYEMFKATLHWSIFIDGSRKEGLGRQWWRKPFV
ncbi:hypothetical protein Tco_0680477 [Tanacetum coccineum]|uniref:Uncharacterized protein n=1 Tax=Tanacetum coccineum TaxID=301880 RepID=A0ABQ4XLV0_9ASTR